MNNDKKKLKLKKAKSPASTIVLYTASIICGIIAIAFLIMNIVVYKNDITQYVAQGYTSAEVVKQLLPRQLLPEVSKAIVVYGGISLILFGIGHINKISFQSLKKTDEKVITDDEISVIKDENEQVLQAQESENKLN